MRKRWRPPDQPPPRVRRSAEALRAKAEGGRYDVRIVVSGFSRTRLGCVEYSILPADVDDVAAIAALHIESWRRAYRGLLPDAFLDGPVVEDRVRLWNGRMRDPDPDRRLVIKAVAEGALLGLACVLLDAEPAWGALLDNLHVKPSLTGQGIGRRLFDEARRWVAVAAPGQAMHLTVMEGNVAARRFYDRQGGIVVERKRIEVVPGTRLAILRYLWHSSSAHKP